MNQSDWLNQEQQYEREEGMNKLTQSIEMSLRAGQKKHNEFVERHKLKSNGAIEGFYKAYCFENDFEDNKRVEEFWNSIHPNVNQMWEFKHLTALKMRGRDEVIDILKTEAVTDILIESNLLEREQFLSLITLGKSIYHDFLGTYLRAITFFVPDAKSFKEEIEDMLEMYGDEQSRTGFRLLCKKIEVRIVSHFDESTQIIIKK